MVHKFKNMHKNHQGAYKKNWFWTSPPRDSDFFGSSSPEVCIFLTNGPVGCDAGQDPCVKLETSWDFNYSSQYTI